MPLLLSLALTASITGRVVGPGGGADGGPAVVAGARVGVRGTTVRTVTGSDGTFSLDGVPDGDYAVDVDPSDQGLEGARRLGVVVAGGNADLGDVNVVAPQSGEVTLSGTATGALAAGGTGPVAGATVLLYGTDKTSSTHHVALTRGDGTYTIPGVGSGVYALFAGANGHDPVVIDRLDLSQSQAVTQDLDLPEAPGRTLSGFVGLSDNPPDRSGSTVRVEGLGVSAVTDHDGYWSVTVPAGLLVVTAHHPGYHDSTECSDAYPGIDCATGWRVPVLGDTSLDLTLLSDPMTRVHVRGLVVEAGSGDALPGARVLVQSAGGSESHAGVTDADGAFDVPGVLVGAQGVTAYLDGYETWQKSFDVAGDLVLDQDSGPLQRIELAPAGRRLDPPNRGCGCGGTPGAFTLGLFAVVLGATWRRKSC